MLRTTAEVPFFCLWRDPGIFRALAHPRFLTIARYEPTTFRKFGSGHLDLLFEAGDRSCILGGIRLDPNQLVIRERSPLIWPVALADCIEHAQLSAIAAALVPWLRSLARGRVMASEAIRRFEASPRFDRARAAGLVGAAPLQDTMPRMAPFVYARRFAAAAHVTFACADTALGVAILADIAAAIDQTEPGGEDEAFARAWYGVAEPAPAQGSADLVITDRHGVFAADIVVETVVSDASKAARIDVPTPVPHDVLFTFDAADAPSLARFGVLARERPLREIPQASPARVVGASAGTVALAVSPEALAAQGDDIAEARTLRRLLTAAGMRVHLVDHTSNPLLAEAQLIHIFGDATEAHTLAFAAFARERGIDYVFDLMPEPLDPSSNLETTLYVMLRASFDDYDVTRYVGAFERSKLEAPVDPLSKPEPTREEFARRAEAFGDLAGGATGIVTGAEDVDRRRAALPPAAAAQVRARGALLEPEPAAEAIAHLVPRAPFAFIHAPVARRSASLLPAMAAERYGLPLVIAGPVYDVDYLHVLRAIAPTAIVLGDCSAGVSAALYRRAAVYIDAAPRPRGASGLLRAIACGALPLLAHESPLARIIGDVVPTFSVRSVDGCGTAMRDALLRSDRDDRITQLRALVAARSDQHASFTTVLETYARLVPTA